MFNNDVPLKVWLAAVSFGKERAMYYKYLALMLQSGKHKPRKLFEDDSERYADKPRGVLSEYWLDANIQAGAKLAASFQGTLPDDEVAILRVAEDSGGDAVVSALHDVAESAKLTDKIRAEILGTLFMGLLALSIALVMWTILPIISVKNAQKGFSNVPLEYWGSAGRALLHYSQFVENYWFLVLIAVIATLAAVYWSMIYLTGAVRDWLDQHIVLYRIARDIKAALFMSTMSMLTRKRGNNIFTTEQSLQKFLDSSRSPWMRWRIEQILQNYRQGRSEKADAFQTGMLSEEMFFFLYDMTAATDLSQAFLDAKQFVTEILLEKIITQMGIYKWVMLISAVILGLGMFVWNIAMLNELRTAMGTVSAMGK